jgi:hypothetical protein
MLVSALTPAALSREAERQRHMARHAEDRPCGYTREAWARRCLSNAARLERAAQRQDA